FTYANEAFLRLTGYSRAEVVGSAPANMLPLDARRRHPWSCQHAGAVRSAIIAAGDRRLDVEITCQPLGESGASLAVLRPCGPQGPVARPGGGAAEWLTAAAFDPMAGVGRDGPTRQVHDAFRDVLGGSRSGWRGARLSRLVHRDDLRLVRDAIDAAL